MTNPLVSIIIPAYNHEKYILECLHSVMNQTYRPIEVIVVDDGSNDKTADLAESFLRHYAKNSIFVRRNNSGAANAINQGIRLSRGEYINILNSDDFFPDDRISTCVDVALRSGREFVFSSVRFVDENSRNCVVDSYILSILKAEVDSSKLPTIGFALMKNQLAVSTGNFFFTRRLFDLVGEFRSYKYVHDWDYILRCLFYVEPIFLQEKLYNYRFHGENSFKSLADIAGYETTEIMRNFLWLVTSRYPINGRAPCSFYWPSVFEDFIRIWNYQIYLPPKYRDTSTKGLLIR